MAITKSAARTRVRQRIRDTVTTYEFSDAILDGYLSPAMKEIAVAVAAVDPDFYLAFAVVKAYTDALDKVASTEQGFEFYPLPLNCASVRWIERADGGYHYKIPIVDPNAQETHRYRAFTSGRVTYDDGVTYTALANATSLGAISIWGNRFRVVPPPTAAGIEWKVVYDKEPVKPEGESENLDIPVAFEEALCLAWGVAIIGEDGDPLAATLGAKLRGNGQNDPGELARAMDQHRKRTVRAIRPQAAW